MITYHNIAGIPDDALMNDILILHENIFSDSHTLVAKMATKPSLLVTVALDHADSSNTGSNGSVTSSTGTFGTRPRIVGYKIGYELGSDTFYSWLGGVNANYRNHGIGSKLMEIQHDYLRQSGYQSVETKTKNKWRSMLILNIKHGFDVVETFLDETGEHKIILRKHLVN